MISPFLLSPPPREVRRRRNRRQMLICAVLLLACLLLAVTGGFISSAAPTLGIICVSLGILSFCTVLTVSTMSYLRRLWVQIVFFIVVYSFGAAVNFVSTAADYSELPYSSLVSSCASLAEFFPSRGSYEAEQWQSNKWYILFYILSYIFSASVILAFLGRKIINRWQLFIAGFQNQHKFVFWCRTPGDKELLLAHDIYCRSNVSQCIFSADEIHDTSMISALTENLNFLGNLLCLRRPGQFHRSCLVAPVHFFLTDDYDWNIRAAQEVLKRGEFCKKADFYVRVSDDGKGVWADRWAENMHKQNLDKDVEIHLIRESSLIVRQMLRQYPLLTAPGVDIDNARVCGDLNVLIIGFGETGRSLLREIVCNGQFVHKNPGEGFNVQIIDPDRNFFDDFAARCPEAVTRYHINFEQMEYASKRFWDVLEKRLGEFHRIIVTPGDGSVNMELAEKIVNVAKRHSIPMTINDSPRLLVCFPGMLPRVRQFMEYSGLSFFGSMNSCYTYDVIVAEILDKNAKMLHEHYNEKLPEKQRRRWRDISMLDKESNRSCAAGMSNIFLLTGYQENNFSRQDFDDLQSKQLFDLLAEVEHLRWSAFLAMRGIRVWKMEDIPTGTSASPNDVNQHLRHAYLVDFQTLDAVDEKFGKPAGTTRSLNRDIVEKNISLHIQNP